MPGVESKESTARKAPETKGVASRKRTLVHFTDERFLRIEYRALDGVDHVSSVNLIYQGKSYSKETIGRILAQYGTSDYTNTRDSVQLYAWGGKRVSEGAVEPSDKVGATLLVEHLPGDHVSIELDAVIR